MTDRPHPLSWLPPFVVGLAGATAAELSVGLLLYVTPGFLRALTLILAVALGSLSLGLWTAPTARDDTFTERVRRRWLLALVAFAVASGTAALWSVREGLAADPLSRGLGLAFLTALPLYACGALLGAMSTPRRSWPGGAWTGASAVAGAAVGIILAGYVLVTLLLPVSIYAFCLVLLSGGALVHGWVIAAEGERTIVALATSPYGELVVEDWTWGKAVHRERILREDGRVRGAEDGRGRPARPWEGGALALLLAVSARGGTPPGSPEEPATSPGFGEAPLAPARFLLLGAGSLTLARELLAAVGDGVVDAFERNRALLELAARELAAPVDHPRLRLLHGDATPGAGLAPGPYRAIVLDAAAVASAAPAPLPARRELESFAARLEEGGVLVFGGMEARRARGAPLEALLERTSPAFPFAARYGSDPGRRRQGLASAADEVMLVFSAVDRPDLPAAAGALRLEAVLRRAADGEDGDGGGILPETDAGGAAAPPLPPGGAGTLEAHPRAEPAGTRDRASREEGSSGRGETTEAEPSMPEGDAAGERRHEADATTREGT